jgi:AmmeMemoRadiSam system protein B/AmmeMemoRadiSam system protein A
MGNTFKHLDMSWYGVNDKNEIKDKIKNLLEESKKYPINLNNVNAVIVPHAGYNYSGLCAAVAYNSIKCKNIVILGTLHNSRDGIFCLDISGETKLKTYVGEIIVDTINDPLFTKNNDVFLKEHSVELQMQFINYLCPDAKVIPLLVGNIDFIKVASVLNKLLNTSYFFVITTDLMHVNGTYGYNVESMEKMFEINRDLIHLLLRPKIKSSDSCTGLTDLSNIDEFIKKHTKDNGIKPTICGINALKLWLNMDLKQFVDNRVAMYHTSIHSHKDLLNDNVKMTNGVVGYASIVYSRTKNENINQLLTRYEELELLKLARIVLERKFNLTDEKYLPIISNNFRLKRGVFVTLNNREKLRGCLGHIEPKNYIICDVIDLVIDSAFNDSRFRFNPIIKEEVPKLTISISLLLDKEELIYDGTNLIMALDKWKLGEDSIIIKNNLYQAIYLPQVYISYNESYKSLSERTKETIDQLNSKYADKLTILDSLSKKAGKTDLLFDAGTQLFIRKGYEFVN